MLWLGRFGKSTVVILLVGQIKLFHTIVISRWSEREQAFSQGGENELAECQRGHNSCRKFVVVHLLTPCRSGTCLFSPSFLHVASFPALLDS